MKTSPNGLNLIKQSEGYRAYQYRDSAGFLTVGYGHKLLPGENLVYVDLPQAEALLEKDCQHVEDALNLYLPKHTISINQNQFDALVDFGFNLGVGSLFKLLSHGLDQVPNQILLWDHSEGHVVLGLLHRRQKELELWTTPVAPDATAKAS